MVNVPDSWDLIYSKLGLPPPRRDRTKCYFHDGDSLTSLSLDEKHGLFYCHVCHAKGDKVGFILQFHDCDFKSALSFFGLAPNKLPRPDTAALRRARIRQNLDKWNRYTARKVGRSLYEYNSIVPLAVTRLEKDVDDDQAWWALSVCYRHLPQREYLHDALISKHTSDKIEAFRFRRATHESTNH